MAGSITVSTISNDTGVFAAQNAVTGIPKAWLNYNQETQTIRNSFNISSVVYNGTGDVTVNFTTAMPNANYTVTASSQNDPSTAPQIVSIFYARTPNNRESPTSSAFRVSNMVANNGAPINSGFVCCAVFSS